MLSFNSLAEKNSILMPISELQGFKANQIQANIRENTRFTDILKPPVLNLNV